MLRNEANDVTPSDLRFDVIGGVVLIDASGVLDGGIAERLGDHLQRLGGRRRPVVVDLTDVSEVGEEAIAVLRRAWREAGDGLRVVARPGSVPAHALKAARLRRFAVHSSLSGALTDATAA